MSALIGTGPTPQPHPPPQGDQSSSSSGTNNEEVRPQASSEAKPAQIQSNFGLQGVVGYVDNSALQLLTVNQAGDRQGINPIILQQASTIQACSLQQTSLIRSSSRPSETEGSSSVSSDSQLSPTTTPTVTSPPGTVQIRRTLNNVNIVNNIGTNFQSNGESASSSNVGASSSSVSNVTSQGPVVLPSVNMGMVGNGLNNIHPFNMGMASTPLLLPQVNGPTLLVNVPNYGMAYQGIGGLPGMFMPGILGTAQIATIGSVASVGPQVVIPSPLINTTSSSSSQTAVVTTIQSSVSSSPPPVFSRSVMTSSNETETQQTLEQNDVVTCDVDMEPVPGPSAKKQSKHDQELDMDCDDDNINEVVAVAVETKQGDQEDSEDLIPEVLTISDSNEHDGISLAALVSPPEMRQRHHSVISHGQAGSSNGGQRPSNQISAIISPRSVSTVQDSLLASTADQADTVIPPSPTSSSLLTPDNSSSQLPQLSLNFPNILMMDNRPQSPVRSSSSSVIVSHNSDLPPSQSPASFSFAGQQPITVDTVEALQSALACDNDVQLVVSNELLETPEFKALMQNMDQSSSTLVSSIQSTPAVSPSPQASEFDQEETRMVETHLIKPPPIVSEPPSPVPCSSRDMSREATRQGFDTSTDSLLSMTPGSDDDMTLQDLIAVETIDESQMAEDDIHWSSQLSFDSFNYISQVIGNRIECDNAENAQSTGKSKKSSNLGKSKTKSTPASSSTITSEEVKVQMEQKSLISNLLKKEPEQEQVEEDLVDDLDSDIKPNMLKQENSSSVATQNPLGAQNKHWKCGQCKVVYESGPQLLEHLDLIKRAKIKCIPCHLVFEDRKDLIAHRRKDHPAELMKLKFDPDSEVIDEPDVVEEKVYIPNSLGEFTCEFCDRAFKDKDLLMKHMSCHIEEKPHECLECGKKFTKANQLREHRKRHFEEGNFQCNFCNKKFFSPNKLREHIRIHTGEAPLKCNICGKGFKRHSNLSEHKKIHEPNREVKPAKELFCHCGKVFKTQRDLDWHKEGEHEMVPKKCTFCLEVFVHSSSLTRHIRMKHEGNFMPEGKKTNNYARCPICSQVFYKTSINKHIRYEENVLTFLLAFSSTMALFDNCIYDLVK